MKTTAGSILRHSINISAVTFFSRLLGLVRVKLEALVLGGDALASGWFFAFALPNLARRLFGEGALGQAFIPLVADAEKNGGKSLVRKQLITVFAWLGIFLAILCIAVSGAAVLLSHIYRAELAAEINARYRIFLYLVPFLAPYSIFICLVGVMTAVLNYFKIFVLPALGSLLLNIFMIAALLCFGGRTVAVTDLKFLSFAVLASGLTQLLMMLILLKIYGCFPDFKKKSILKDKIICDLAKLALPGFISGAVVQASFLADRGVAILIGNKAIPALTYVDRLIDIPIGIFAVSMSSVLMASMSRSAASGNIRAITDDLTNSLRQIFFICVPMAAGIAFFHEILIRLLCYGGKFTAEDLAATKLVCIFYSIGIPFFCTLKAITPCFLARKKMKTVCIVSIAAVILNIGLNLILMHPLKQGGIALATVFSSLLNNLTLLWLLHREGFALPFAKLGRDLLKCAAIALLCGIVVSQSGLAKCDLSVSWGRQFAGFTVAAMIFVAGYFGIAALCRFPEIKEILALRRKNAA